MIDRAAIVAKIKAAIAAASADTGTVDDGVIADAFKIIPPTTASEPAPLDAVGKAKQMIRWLRQLGFTAYLEGHVLLIADATGRGRDVSRRLPIGDVFNTLNAGLDEDPALLDEEDGQTPSTMREDMCPPCHIDIASLFVALLRRP